MGEPGGTRGRHRGLQGHHRGGAIVGVLGVLLHHRDIVLLRAIVGVALRDPTPDARRNSLNRPGLNGLSISLLRLR